MQERKVRTATDVGVDVVGAKEHCLAWLEGDKVEEEDDVQTNVFWELAVKAREQLGEHFAAGCGSCLAPGEAFVLFLHLCK